MSRILNIKDGRRAKKGDGRLRQYTFNTEDGGERVSIMLSDWSGWLPSGTVGGKGWGMADIHAGSLGGVGISPEVRHHCPGGAAEDFVTVHLGDSVTVFLSGEQAQQLENALAESLTRD
jgi:hypothetical protein